jgi:hypothetical protein
LINAATKGHCPEVQKMRFSLVLLALVSVLPLSSLADGTSPRAEFIAAESQTTSLNPFGIFKCWQAVKGHSVGQSSTAEISVIDNLISSEYRPVLVWQGHFSEMNPEMTDVAKEAEGFYVLTYESLDFYEFKPSAKDLPMSISKVAVNIPAVHQLGETLYMDIFLTKPFANYSSKMASIEESVSLQEFHRVAPYAPHFFANAFTKLTPYKQLALNAVPHTALMELRQIVFENMRGSIEAYGVQNVRLAILKNMMSEEAFDKVVKQSGGHLFADDQSKTRIQSNLEACRGLGLKNLSVQVSPEFKRSSDEFIDIYVKTLNSLN